MTTDTELLDAAREVERFTKSLKALVAIGPVLKAFGSMAQAQNEAQAKLDAVHAEAAEEARKLAQLQDQIGVAKKGLLAHADAVAEKHAAADAEIADKRAQADKDIADAQAQAQVVLAAAADKAKQAIADADAGVAARQAALAEVDKQIEAKRAEAAAEEERLAGIQAQLAGIREKI